MRRLDNKVVREFLLEVVKLNEDIKVLLFTIYLKNPL